MHDIKYIRENPDQFDVEMKRRGLSPQAEAILALDSALRAETGRMNDMQTQRNAASKQIGAAKGAGDEEKANALMAEVAELKKALAESEETQRIQTAELTDVLMRLPNIMEADVPEGEDEDDNEEVRVWGEPTIMPNAKQHFDLGEDLGQLDFETAAKISGARFAFLSGDLAKLERAIANFMLDLHTDEHGMTEMVTPVLVKDDAMYGTNQLPKFAEDAFKVSSDFWLIPTSEVTLTNTVRDSIQNADALPKRLCAWSQCFRSEAGSAGRDTRGLIRMHQFSKVEMVAITTPDKSDEEHQRMLSAAEEVLKRLELPFRTVKLCSGDIGFGAQKTFDLEVWLPGQGAYREISSVSNCGDFQARRMMARYRDDDHKPQYVHTLNGSGLAVGRTMVAIMENYQQADGSIAVPTVLQPYMGGKTVIAKA